MYQNPVIGQPKTGKQRKELGNPTTWKFLVSLTAMQHLRLSKAS